LADLERGAMPNTRASWVKVHSTFGRNSEANA